MALRALENSSAFSERTQSRTMTKSAISSSFIRPRSGSSINPALEKEGSLSARDAVG